MDRWGGRGAGGGGGSGGGSLGQHGGGGNYGPFGGGGGVNNRAAGGGNLGGFGGGGQARGGYGGGGQYGRGYGGYPSGNGVGGEDDRRHWITQHDQQRGGGRGGRGRGRGGGRARSPLPAEAAAKPAAATAAGAGSSKGVHGGVASSAVGGGGKSLDAVPKPAVDQAVEVPVEESQEQGIDKKNKKKIICDVCEGNHIARRCPLFRQQKPVAAMCGFGVDGLGFYYFSAQGNPKVAKVSKSAVTKVIGGQLSGEQLIKEMKRIVPVDEWE